MQNPSNQALLKIAQRDAALRVKADWRHIGSSDRCWYELVRPQLSGAVELAENIRARYAELAIYQAKIASRLRMNNLGIDLDSPQKTFAQLLKILDHDRANRKDMYGHVRLERINSHWVYPNTISKFLRSFYDVFFLVSDRGHDELVLVRPGALLATLDITRLHGLVFGATIQEARERLVLREFADVG